MSLELLNDFVEVQSQDCNCELVTRSAHRPATPSPRLRLPSPVSPLGPRFSYANSGRRKYNTRPL